MFLKNECCVRDRERRKPSFNGRTSLRGNAEHSQLCFVDLKKKSSLVKDTSAETRRLKPGASESAEYKKRQKKRGVSVCPCCRGFEGEFHATV